MNLIERANNYMPEINNEYVYGDVIFIQGEEADEAIDILQNHGEDAVIKYLSQWDQGEYHTIYSHYDKTVGASDDIYETDQYVLTYNTRLNYIGLLTKLPKDKYGEYVDESIKEELSVPEKHQKKIAIDTLKMHDVGANIMGGMTKEEARKFLSKIGYTDEKITKLEK